jgi:hypothetical protein
MVQFVQSVKQLVIYRKGVALDWLATVHDNWDSLYSLVRVYHPNSPDKSNREYNITAARAEVERKHFENLLKELGSDDVLVRLTRAKLEGNTDIMYSIFSQTWFGIPEDRGLISRLKGFNVLCDLCSEYGEEEGPETD